MTVEPFRGHLTGSVLTPGSKSATNRALILAAAAEGRSTIRNILKSDDSYWCIEALRQLGVSVEEEGSGVSVTRAGTWKTPDEPLFIGSAGTIARFLTSLLALTTDAPIRIHASAQMSQRPMRPLFEALAELGASLTYEGEPYSLPVALGPTLAEQAAAVHIAAGQSSQYLSGLLMAAPLLRSPVTIHVDGSLVQRNYVSITLDIMSHFGVEVEPAPGFSHFDISPSRYTATEYTVEPDASTASYFFGLAAVTGGEMTLPGLKAETLQPDIKFLAVLERMGCLVSNKADGITVKGPMKLHGGFSIDMKEFSDTALTVAALAVFADAPVEITNVAHIRAHESDRIHGMATELMKAGVPVQEREDGLLIEPASPQRTTLHTYDDHRMAMSLALVGVGGSGMVIDDPGCVSKTCPQFFDELSKLGIELAFQ